MPLFKFNSHPAPGFHMDGSMVTLGESSPGSVKKKTTTANINFQGGSGFGGGGSASGGGIGNGAGSFGDGSSGSFSSFSGGASAHNVDRYNPIRDRLEEGSVVEDWIPRDASGLDEMFRLMYHRDHIAGTIVDLIAEMIWSDFDLDGIQDPVIKNYYYDSMESINVEGIMPDITREFLVLGRSISSGIFDKSRGIFKDIISHDPSFVRLTPIPIKGFDPKIDLIPSPSMRMFVDSEDPRDIDARRVLPAAYLEAVRAASGGTSAAGGYGMQQSYLGAGGGASDVGGIPLDPINTLFLPRRRFNYDYIGTSLFTRLITFWALEKALVNATVVSARRRSRSILHIKAGIDNIWEPSAQEMDNISGMFIQADEDPVGAVITTRTGIDTDEIRSGQDFYKWADEWELLNEGKLRALGANDALLSGDSTYSNQENARMFFMERALSLRDSITQRLFYKRLFPLLARIHGFRRRTQAELNHKIRTTGSNELTPPSSHLTQRQALEIPQSELIMPTINWRKELVSNVDDQRLDIYERLEEKGVPIHLRDWASAGNLDLDTQVEGLDLDADIRKQVNHWKNSFENEAGVAEEEAKLEFINSLRNLAHSKLKHALGSKAQNLGPLSQYIFWGNNGNIGPLKASELSDFLEKISTNDNSYRVLADGVGLRHKLLNFFHNPISADIAHFLIYRTGLTPVSPKLDSETLVILSDSIKSKLDDYASNGNVYQLGQIATKELNAVAKLSATNRSSMKKQMDRKIESTEKKVSKKTNIVDDIPANSKHLFSGK